jgi:integrase
LNPGSPTPQAGILIQSRAEFPRIVGKSTSLSKLDDDPALQEYNSQILKTIEEMTATGLKKNTKDSTFRTLRRLNRETDLMNPEAVKLHIGKLCKKNGEPLENSSKQKITNNYDYFVQANGLQWTKPVYKYDTKVPITPTREQAEAIISAAPTIHAATIFRILLEAGFEGEELHNTHEPDIDTEQGIITVAGTKGHNGRRYKFKAATAEMLRIYMATHHKTHPFTTPKIMADSWRTARATAAKKLSRQDLLKIPLKGLRNLSGIIIFQKCKDPWTTMLHMGHKKLDTTQQYLRAMTQQPIFEQEYISKAVQLGTPNTIKEIMELIETGFKKETEADGYQIFKKPK